MLRSRFLALFAALALAASSAHAALIRFDVDLSGVNESPPNASPGTGTAQILIDTIVRTMQIDVDFAGLLGLTTVAHIHCCQVPPATTAMVATQTPTFEGFPVGVQAGTYSHLFDMTLASSYNPAFITAHGGTVDTAFADLLAGMFAGQSYLNIHTNLFPGGEIRGTLIAVPEPATLALVGAALVGVGALRRRKTTA